MQDNYRTNIAFSYRYIISELSKMLILPVSVRIIGYDVRRIRQVLSEINCRRYDMTFGQENTGFVGSNPNYVTGRK
jgi:hypothetical protein